MACTSHYPKRVSWACLLLLCLPLTASAVTYYAVASGGSGSTCSIGSPCTLNGGLAKLASGDTLYLRSGTYGGIDSNVTGAIPSGTSYASATTIASYPGETATVASMNLTAGNCGGPAMAYIIFDRLRFTDGALPTVSLCGDGISYIRIQYCEFVGNFPNAVQLHNPLTGPGQEILYNYFHDSTRYGFYNAASDILIHGNTFVRNRGYGIQSTYDAYTMNNVVITNNVISEIGHDAFATTACGLVVSKSSNVLVANNVIYNNTDASGTGCGIQVATNGALTNSKIYNNTLYNNTVAFNILPGSNSSNIIRNNIAWGNTNDFAFTSPGTATIQDNLCQTPTYCGITSNPLFIAAGSGNFQLQATSPAIDTGAILALVPTDILGVTRPQGAAYDLGAYEYLQGGGEPATGNPIYVSAGGHSDTPSDSNTCVQAETITTPKATFASALTCMTVPGKTLYVRGGTYAERIDTLTQPIAGGNAGAPTTIEGYQSEVAILALPASQPMPIALFLRGNDSYLTFRNLTIDAMNRASSNAIALYDGTTNIVFESVEARKSFYETVFILDADDITLMSVTLHDSSNGDGLGLYGASNTITVKNSVIYGNGGGGIKAYIGSGSGNGLTIRETVIRNNTGSGVQVSTTTGALLANLLVYSNSVGIHIMTGASGLKLYQATVANNTGVGIQCDLGASGVVMINNISYLNGTNVITNNCSAALSTNLITDPGFVNPGEGDYTLQSIGAGVNAGTTLPEVTIALDGTLRPQGSLYDVGAYESTEPPVPDSVTRALAAWPALFFF